MSEVSEYDIQQMKLLQDTLAAQHPLFGMMGEVFQEMGGKAFIREWAEEHPGQYIGYLFKGAPSVAPTHGITGDVNIVINNALQPTELDAVTLDEQGRVITHAVQE
jgi:hypothetical protein